MNRVKTDTFNVSDAMPKVEKTLKLLRLGANYTVASMDYLTDIARKEIFCNGTCQILTMLYRTVNNSKLTNLAAKLIRDFNAFCGAYKLVPTNKRGGKAPALNRKMNIIDFNKNGIAFTEDLATAVEYCRPRYLQLLEDKQHFMSFTPLMPVNEDLEKIAKQRLQNIINTLHALKDSINDWKDTESAAQITKLLCIAAAYDETLKDNWLENQIAKMLEIADKIETENKN